ncbi:MAG: hypothetical protein IJR02_02465 [Bacteroidaceae bacterium]|nr:hypothetical protein [Bacteroidaceae bacterium]
MKKATYEAPRMEVFHINTIQMLNESTNGLKVASSDLDMDEEEVLTGGDMWHWSR